MSSPKIVMPSYGPTSHPFAAWPMVPETNLAAGVWLQFSDEPTGTRDVYILSPEEAESLAMNLFRAATESRVAFAARDEVAADADADTLPGKIG